MTSEAIKAAVRSSPFRPFSVRLANGSQIQISSQDNVAVHPDGKTFVTGGDKEIDIWDLKTLTSAATTLGSSPE